MARVFAQACGRQVEVVQEGPVDAAERGAADERQMTSAADSLYDADLRAQTVTLPAMASVSALGPSTPTLNIKYIVLFVI